MREKLLFQIFTFIIILFYITSLNNYNELKYYTNIYYRLTHINSNFSVIFNKKNGIQVEFHEIKEIYYENSPDVDIIDYKLKKYNLTNEELGIMSMKELFKNFNKISFPNKTDCREPITDIPIWHLIVDGKDYYGNLRTIFLDEFDDLVKLENIREYVEKLYYNKTNQIM